MKRIASLTLLLIFSLGLLMTAWPTRGRAQDGVEWGEILNPDGSVNWNNLTLVGETTEPADWMNANLGGIEIPLGNATYNQYVTPSGQLLVLPSPTTLLMSYLDPVGSGLANNPPSVLQNIPATLALLANGYYDPTTLPPQYVNPQDFFQAVINGQENIFSFVSPEFLLNVIQMSFDAGYLVNALWLYPPGVNCAALPGGCPPGFGITPTPVLTPGPTPIPQRPDCPAPFVTAGKIIGTGSQIAPLKPVVVGQDPEKRGVDLQVTVQIPPVEYHWYEANTILNCEYRSNGSGSGCPGPASRYDDVTGRLGQDSWTASMAGSSRWDEADYTECIEHVETFADYLAFANLSASLNPESRAWILNYLALAYPGAGLKHPDWAFPFNGPGSANGSNWVNWTQTQTRIQVADPGTYQIRLQGRTTGTPVSAPRSFALDLDPFLVEMLRVTLIEQP